MARYDVAFLLVPKFSMIALYGALEPLRVANRFAGANTFSWRFVSADGQPVAASNDIPVSVSGGLADIGKPDMAVISASYEPEKGVTRPLLAVVKALARKRVLLAAIDTAPFILAAAGLLDDHRATCHWESLPGFRESYPRVLAEQALYVIDRDRMTCAGGAAAIDMMLDWIGRQMGRPLAVLVADQLVHFRSVEQPTQARLPAAARYGTTDARLLKIITVMEEQGEDPLEARALADLAGISVRQMERLFAEKLGERPMGFYLKLRLEKAERLITYSTMTMREIAVACGFSSLPLFSRSFRARYGRPPSELRA
ncbi:GlxA family transcriptional regulator [Aestuariivirga sp.]|uniref:GlxA family transcriptional regulator n=1 Tax=Aestuariivirga sp. TaxID=2650926 RepID=UPI003016952D